MSGIVFLTGYIAGLATLLIFWIAGFVLGPWSRALTSGAPVPLMGIVGMRLRRSPPHLLIDAYVRLKKKGVNQTMDKLETLYLTHRDDIQTAGDLVHLVKEHAAE